MRKSSIYLVLFRKYSLGLSKGLWLALPLPPELRKSTGDNSVFEENQQVTTLCLKRVKHFLQTEMYSDPNDFHFRFDFFTSELEIIPLTESTVAVPPFPLFLHHSLIVAPRCVSRQQQMMATINTVTTGTIIIAASCPAVSPSVRN